MKMTQHRKRPYLKTIFAVTSMGLAVILSACGSEKTGLQEDVDVDSLEVRSSISEGSAVYGVWTIAQIEQESVKKTTQIRVERGKVTAITLCESGKDTVKAFASSSAIISQSKIDILSTSRSQRSIMADGLRIPCEATISAGELAYKINGATISVTQSEDPGFSERWKKTANL